MNDQNFQGLDAFVRRHRPEVPAVGAAPAISPSSGRRWLALALSACVVFAVIGGWQWRQQSLNAEAVLLAESLEFDVDEFELEPEELTDLVAVLGE